MSTPATPTTARRVPALDDSGRFPDEYAPQAVLDAVVATETAQGKAEEAQAAAERKAQELADAKGAAGGIGSLTGAGRQPDSEVNANLTPQALSATFVSLAELAETATLIAQGNSYQKVTDYRMVPDAAKANARIASRLGMTLDNRGLPGRRMDEISEAALATGTTNFRGFIFLIPLINDPRQYLNTSGVATTAEAFRTLLALDSSRAILDYSSTAFAFDSTWTAGASSTAGGHVDIAVSGDKAFVALEFAPSGGTGTIKKADGTTVATFTTGGYAQTFTGVVPLTGLGSGNRTLRLTVNSGTVKVRKLIVPSPNPPTILWWEEGPVPENLGGVANDLLMNNYRPACEAIAATFPNVVVIPSGPGWDGPAMTVADGLHPNDLGYIYMARRVIDAMRALPARNGQNFITIGAEAAYVSPTPNYVGSGATAPGAATGLTATTANQVSLSWTRAATDGGATITGQRVERSAAGANTWTTVTTLSRTATSLSISTGLTQGTSYDFRVVTITDAGTTASATATATAGQSVTVYGADDFERADSATTLGSTPIGSLAWINGAANVIGITSGKAYRATSSGTPSGAGVDTGQANGTVKATVEGAAVGIMVNDNLQSTGGGYLFRKNDTGFAQLDKRTNGAYAALNTSSVAVVDGDVLEVVRSGSSLVCKVNGATVATVTDATYTTTRHGIWMGSPAARVRDVEFNSLTS